MVASNPPRATSDSQLPFDPDIDVLEPAPVPRPLHLRWRHLGLVALGGSVGTAVRDGLNTLLPADGGVSWTIFWINLTGAFLLGVLLETLAHRGRDQGRRRTLRLLLGTGVLGGFTTYSTLAVSCAAVILDGDELTGIGYALLTVIAGVSATTLGLCAAAGLRPREARA